MAITVTLTQTRPNTSVNFYNASTNFKAFKKEMIDAGTLIDSGGSNDETDLIRTWTLTFTNAAAQIAFENDNRTQSYVDARGTYNRISGITEIIE